MMFLSFQYDGDEDLDIAAERFPSRHPLGKQIKEKERNTYVDLVASNRDEKLLHIGNAIFEDKVEKEINLNQSHQI